MVIASSPADFRNSYKLNLESLTFIEKKVHDVSAAYIIRMISSKWFDEDKRPKTLKELARTGLEYTKQNFYWLFEKNNIDDQRLEEYFNISPESEPRKSLLRFPDIWRGYTHDDLQRELPLADQNRKILLKSLRNTDRKIKRRISKFHSNSKRYRYLVLQKEFNDFKLEIRRLAADRRQFAKRQLSIKANIRRNSWMRREPFVTPLFHDRLKRFDPRYVEFPLHHLDFEAKFYFRLEDFWMKTGDRERLLEKAREATDWPYFLEQLKNLYESNSAIVGKEYANAIGEVTNLWRNRDFASATIITIAIIEGILWNFAEHLNKKNIRIFKVKGGKKLPYRWDWKLSEYKDKNPKTKRPIVTKNKNNRLRSARELLEKTRLGAIINADFFSFLVSDFYDVRNDIMHGNFKGVDFAIEAPAVLFALYGLIEDISNYFSKYLARNSGLSS